MTLPIPDSQFKLSFDDWVPGQERFFLPTLIFPCGKGDMLDELKQKVIQRLGPQVAEDIVHWAAVLDPAVTVDDRQIESELTPTLAYDYWQRLEKKGYVANLPDAQHHMPLHVLVVCNPLDHGHQDALADWLNKLASTIKSTKSYKRLDCTLTLLMLGDPVRDVEKLQAYWPRFYLGKVAWGGTQITPQHALQVCQNVIVSLLTSELPRFIEHVVGKQRKSVQWIDMGTSAILVDLQSAKDRFESEVLSQFTNRLVSPSPDETQRDLLNDAAEEKRREFQNNLLAQAAQTAKSLGWDITIKEYKSNPDLKWPAQRQPEPQVLRNKAERQGCYLAYESHLAKAVFGETSSWWLNERDDVLFIPPTYGFFQRLGRQIQFGWKRFKELFSSINLPGSSGLEELLAENYEKLIENLRRDVGETSRRGFQDLLDTLAFLIERRGFTGGKLPLDSSVNWPAGLQAGRYIIGSIAEHLTDSVVFSYAGEPVHPSPLVSADYWLVAARADVAAIEDGVRRCERSRRSIFTPWGILLKLLVAWPLVVGFLQLFLSNWSMVALALVSAGLLILLGLIELLVWRVKYDLLLRQVRSQINARLADRVLALVARVVQDDRLRVAALLPPLQRVFSELALAFQHENERVLQECAQFSKQAGNREEDTLYWLMDYEQILGTRSVIVTEDYGWNALMGETAFVWDETGTARTMLSWKSEAKRHANTEASQKSDGKFEKAEIAFIVEHAMPLLHKPKSAPTVIQELRQFSNIYAELEFKADLLSSYTQADKCDAFKDGLKWHWLYQHAHPLSGEVKKYSLVTVITVPDEVPLKLGTGRSSTHWPKDAQVVFSRQLHEIGCLRAVIEWA